MPLHRYDSIDTHATPTLGEAAEAGEHLGRAVSPRRVRVAFALLLVATAFLLFRGADLQLVRRGAFAVAATRNRTRTELIVPTRGTIRDRTGALLAWNVPAYALGVVPADLPTGSARGSALAEIASAVGVTPDAIASALTGYPPHLTEAVTIRDGLSYDEAIALYARAANTPAVRLIVQDARAYADARTPGLSHLVGYLGRVSANEYATSAPRYLPNDRMGRAGIEASYEAALRGIAGRRAVTIDAYGRVVAISAEEAPIAGTDITLGVDLHLQDTAERALRAVARRAGSRRGVAVVLDPHSGELLALVSIPTFDASGLARGLPAADAEALFAHPDAPLFNRAVSGMYPSGSTIKPMVAAAAIHEGVVGSQTRIHSTGGVQVDRVFFPDWREGGHGWVTVREAIAQSVNTFFYLVAGGKPRAAPVGMSGPTQEQALGPARLSAALRAFGFGQRTGVDLPGESPGLVPDSTWKQRERGEAWFIGDTYHLAIGQGDILVTPLQLAVATAAFVNGGYRIAPHVVREPRATQPPNARIPLLTPDAVAAVRAGMRAAVTEGSARQLADLPFSVYGKTGTAEHASGTHPHAWFAGWAEVERRQVSGVRTEQIVVAILIEEGGEGSRSAVLAAREIFMEWALRTTQP